MLACTAVGWCLGEPLHLNYHNINYTDNHIEIGLIFEGPYHHFLAEAFTREDVIGKEETPRAYYSSNELTIRIPRVEYFNGSEPMFLRIVAMDEHGIICSDAASRSTFYQFTSEGLFPFNSTSAQSTCICIFVQKWEVFMALHTIPSRYPSPPLHVPTLSSCGQKTWHQMGETVIALRSRETTMPLRIVLDLVEQSTILRSPSTQRTDLFRFVTSAKVPKVSWFIFFVILTHVQRVLASWKKWLLHTR